MAARIAFLLSSVGGILTIPQLVLAFLLQRPGSGALAWAGWICMWTAGIFGLLPVFTFRRKGSVPKGKSYVKTTLLVDTGITPSCAIPRVEPPGC